jgi:hypothetical protein
MRVPCLAGEMRCGAGKEPSATQEPTRKGYACEWSFGWVGEVFVAEFAIVGDRVTIGQFVVTDPVSILKVRFRSNKIVLLRPKETGFN